jgi:hypothetical protein
MVYRPQDFTYSFSVDDTTEDIPHRPTSLLGRLFQPSTTIEELFDHFDFKRRWQLHDSKS